MAVAFSDLELGQQVIVTDDDKITRLRRVVRKPWQLANGDWVVELSGVSAGTALSKVIAAAPIRPGIDD